MEPIWFALLNTATPNSLPNRNTSLQRWRYGKYLLYRSLFTQIHGPTHCTYLVILELCGCFRVFLDYDHASFMTHTYIIRIGRLLFRWQKLLTSACRRCRVSAVAESVSDTDRSTGFAQIMLAHIPASNAVLAAVFNRTDYCIRTLNTLALLWCLQISWDLYRFI